MCGKREGCHADCKNNPAHRLLRERLSMCEARVKWRKIAIAQVDRQSIRGYRLFYVAKSPFTPVNPAKPALCRNLTFWVKVCNFCRKSVGNRVKPVKSELKFHRILRPLKTF